MPYKERKKRLAYMKRYNEERAKRRMQIDKAIRAGDYEKAKQLLNIKITVTPGLIVGN